MQKPVKVKNPVKNVVITYDVGFKPNIPQTHQMGRKLLGSNLIDVALVELACVNCMDVIYKPLMLWSNTDITYPDLNALENQLGELRHTAPVFASQEHVDANLPGGFSNCGPYKIVRIWREWKDPNRDKENQNESK